MRGHRTAGAAVALTALVMGIAVGLLAMHVLPVPGSTGLMSSTMSKTAAAPALAIQSEIEVADSASSDHRHDVLSCILFLVGDITLVIAAAWAIRGRRAFGAPRPIVHRVTELVQRPPPTLVRLSLAGTSRC